MSWAAWVIVATFPLLGLAISRVASVWVVIARLLRTWQRRELQRRELSVLSSRDFGDLAVPQSLINEEIRRWPWQKWALPLHDEAGRSVGLDHRRPIRPRQGLRLQCLERHGHAP